MTTRTEFFEAIEGEIAVAGMPVGDVDATVGEWFQAGDPIGTMVGYLDEGYDYWIIISDLNVSNPPNSSYDITFKDSGYNLLNEIPGDVALVALQRLPYVTSKLPWIIAGVGIVGIGLAYVAGRKPEYYRTAYEYGRKGVEYGRERVAR